MLQNNCAIFTNSFRPEYLVNKQVIFVSLDVRKKKVDFRNHWLFMSEKKIFPIIESFLSPHIEACGEGRQRSIAEVAHRRGARRPPGPRHTRLVHRVLAVGWRETLQS